MIVEIFLLGIIILFLHRIFKKPENLPPGDWGWPIIGVIAPRGEEFNKYLEEKRKKYGNVFTLKMGSRIFIILGDYDIIKTALSKPEMQGRPDVFSFQVFNYFLNLGLGASWGNVWQNNRRFTIRHLRDFGLGKTQLQDKIREEAGALATNMEKQLDKPTEMKWTINVAVLNVIWSLVADKRYEIDDKEIQHFIEIFNELFETLEGPVLLLDIFPSFIPYIPYLPKFISNNWMKMDNIYDTRDKFNGFLMKDVEEHMEKLDRHNPRDFIDTYLLEMENQKDNPESTMREDKLDLVACIADLFGAGTETTSTTLRWMFLLMTMNQDIQKKVHLEIDEFVPSDRLPMLEDKEKMPYFEACVSEIQRFASLLPFGLIHSTLTETTLAGYNIPKGAILMPHQAGVHARESVWERPTEFYPEHFLDKNGKYVSNKHLIPFGIGRRQCLGESMAKMELFLFSAAIFQKYKLSPVPGVKLSSKRHFKAFFNLPEPYKVIITKRT